MAQPPPWRMHIISAPLLVSHQEAHLQRISPSLPWWLKQKGVQLLTVTHTGSAAELGKQPVHNQVICRAERHHRETGSLCLATPSQTFSEVLLYPDKNQQVHFSATASNLYTIFTSLMLYIKAVDLIPPRRMTLGPLTQVVTVLKCDSLEKTVRCHQPICTMYSTPRDQSQIEN